MAETSKEIRVNLTTINVRTLDPADHGVDRVDFRDNLCPGLVLRVSRSKRGVSRAWYLIVTRNRTKVRLLIGYYQGKPTDLPPLRRRDAPLLTLDDAKRTARDEMKKADRGVDLATARGAGSVVELVGAYIDSVERFSKRHKRPASPVTVAEYRRYLETDIAKAPFADLPAADLRRGPVRLWLDELRGRAPVIADRVLALLKAAFTWACDLELLQINDLAPLKLQGAAGVRERFLFAHELRALWLALAALRGTRRAYVDATELLVLTGVRRSMVLTMRRGDFQDLDGAEPLWAISPERTKGKRTHLVPLSPQALKVVRRRLKIAEGNTVEYLFPIGGKRAGENLPMTWSSHFVADLVEKTQAMLGEEAPEMEPWCVHEFRHTINTHLCGTLKVRAEVADLILAHKGKRYNLAELLDERRTALVSWGAWLDQNAAPTEKKGADIVPLTGRAG